jgi:hypothetical protein
MVNDRSSRDHQAGTARSLQEEASKSELATAVRHVTEGRRIVADQQARIARLAAGGHPTLDHQQTLDIFESTLRILEEHERTLRERKPHA